MSHPTKHSTCGAWLELARLSNLPTVASNCLAGAALGAVGASAAGYPWCRVAIAAAGVGLMYIAGMILNDVCDLAVDRIERPARPLPSGRIERRHALGAAIVCLVAGMGLLWVNGIVAGWLGAVLAIYIVAYDVGHRRWAWMMAVMGACRGMVYLVAAAVWPLTWPVLAGAAVLTGYTVSISLVARSEHKAPSRIRIVLAMLAGISVLDAAILVLLHQYPPAAAAGVCAVATALAHRRISGT
jgi:4-hydroxybenzoate polyprenyltransferase